MPKIVGYTPPWLSKPSAGLRMFTDQAPQSPASPSKRTSYVTSPSPGADTYQGPNRLLAKRGSEIFVVVGNQIRWADLTKVKHDWEELTQPSRGRDSTAGPNKTSSDDAASYRTLSTPVYYKIRQLVISPSGAYLAICTEHTVHVAVLPDSSRLSDQDRSPIKLKTYHLGPTIHVIPESPLASVLWHPLAAATKSTDCLVTVTTEAAVRVWELDRSNQWSFERPALAIDLRKLADGLSCDQDFEPLGFGKNRGFSVDDFEMEIAAACFGGQGYEDEDAWASMTLWIAMRNGDVYALCPLLPSKWLPTATTIPSLTTSAVSTVASLPQSGTDPDLRRAADQQYEWVQEIDTDEPVIYQDNVDGNQREIRLRPQNPSAIPRLQGPFELVLGNEDLDLEVSDIYCIPPRLDESDILSGEDYYDDLRSDDTKGLPFTLICLACSNGSFHIAIDLEGVSGQWLPKRGRSTFGVPLAESRELTVVETLSTGQSSESSNSCRAFTANPVDQFSLFMSDGSTVFSLSLGDWIGRLSGELQGEEDIDHGLQTRLEVACQQQICVCDELVSNTSKSLLSTPVVFDDIDLGYFLFSSTSDAAYAVSFDQPHLRSSLLQPAASDMTAASPSRFSKQLTQLVEPEDTPEPAPKRSPYAPGAVFYQNAGEPIDRFRRTLPPQQKKVLTESPIKLSPALLDVMTSAHRTISKQTVDLESAAAELFRRCDRLRAELYEQVRQICQLAQLIQNVSTIGDREDSTEHKTHDERIETAKQKQDTLTRRYEALRRKAGRVGSSNQELSTREIGWVDEINNLSAIVGSGNGSGSGMGNVSLATRLQTARKLAQDLVTESKALAQPDRPQSSQTPKTLDASTSSIRPSSSGSIWSDSPGSPAATPRKAGGNLVNSRIQKDKVANIMAMIEREAAVIDAAMARLERLNL